MNCHLTQDKNGTHYDFQRSLTQPTAQRQLRKMQPMSQVKITQTIQNPAIPNPVSNQAKPEVQNPWEDGPLANAVGWDYVNRSAIAPMIEGITAQSFG
jgi:hypothetical protein